jgi:hypothetical protein
MSSLKVEETNYSLAFLVPKPAYFMWLGQVVQASGLSINGSYFEEEDLACLIPRIGTFTSESLTEYLSQVKRQLMVKTFGGHVVSDYAMEASAFVEFGYSGTEDPSSTAMALAPNQKNRAAPSRFKWLWLKL